MVKRRYSTTGDLEWLEEDAEVFTHVNDSTDEEDASYQPKAKLSKGKNTGSKRKANQMTKDASEEASNSSNTHQTVLPHEIHPKSLHTVQSSPAMRLSLLKWYRGVHDARGMPWRKPYDPLLGRADRAQRAYEVWISEIMLQQTQVVTVIPYYNRWIEKFPTICHLAAATLDEVNAIWKGLGYYSRARRLLEGAQKAVKDFSGRLPDNAKDLESHIPGIGRYSAGAISSIAYGERVPVLDGNVHRLLSRVLALHANPKAKGTLDILWAAAAAMVESQDHTPLIQDGNQPQYAGDINQALIELGSTVCKVRDPDCGSCPLQSWCSAFRISGTSDKQTPSTLTDIEDLCRVCEPFAEFEGVTSYPLKAERKKAREELDIVNVIEWRSLIHPESRHFLMVRRPAGGLLAGLYEFPSSVNVAKDLDQDSQSKLPNWFCSQLLEGDPPLITQVQNVGEVLHVFSHIRKTYRVQWAVLEGSEDSPPPLLMSRVAEPPMKKPKSRKSAQSGNSFTNPHDPTSAVWVPLEEVANTNMGTGVVKIWALTKKLWEEKTTG
ncbi:DNA glycosylase [Crepidotus variabilis]|uniref:Adenine DNA glycosylase n=1 Tax=Crepidotus variabilis TaxID=179855 RepID=A0A9P6JJQ4_9AGAR|nr:DNA glycosylase [Crepidotus variabilis]